MKLPYGISDFKSLRQEGYLYIDKTKYIERLEGFSNKCLFFIRPRRFGKSLFLSTLENYYDINSDGDFDRLFGDLYIGQNPTPLKNSYLVLKLNFSGLNTRNRDHLEESFKSCLKFSVTGFFNKYKSFFEDAETLKNKTSEMKDSRSIIELLIEAVKNINKKVYLIIDEYDHFANDIIAMGEGELYKAIVRASGFVRDFYETVKIGTESVIDRIFITGISPVMLDDLTSGFNIALNLTTNNTLNEMLGFTKDEVKQVIDEVSINRDKQEVMEELKSYYNGYLFSVNGRERVFNPDMVLYFFMQYELTGGYPENLIDANVKTDYGKLNRLVRHDHNRKVLDTIIKEEHILSNIVTEFSFDTMYDKEYFVSLLFYMGLLTIQEKKYGTIDLCIPNYVVRTVYWEYFEKRLRQEYSINYTMEELAKAIWQMAYEGEIKPFLDFISNNVLSQLSNRDLIEFDEKYIKVSLFSYLIMTGLFEPASEREVEKGYIDIYLEKGTYAPDVKYEWIIELKYLKKADKDELEQAKVQGLAQLERYATSRGVVGRQDVKKAVVVFVGKDEYFFE